MEMGEMGDYECPTTTLLLSYRLYLTNSVQPGWYLGKDASAITPFGKGYQPWLKLSLCQKTEQRQNTDNG